MRKQLEDLVSAQRYEEARTLCMQICRDNDSDFESWFLLGALNGQLGQVAEAIRCCNKVISLQPGHAEAWFNLAQAYRMQGKLDKSVAAYRRALELEPLHQLAQGNLIATLRYQAGTANPARQAELRSPEELLGMGNRARERGNWGEALACYQAAVNLKADYPDALRNLGQAYLDLRRPGEAVEYFRRLLALQPDDSDTRFMLGNALRDDMKLSAAIGEYQAALKLDPNNIDVLHNIGITWMQAGDAERAVEIFRRVLDRDATRDEARSCLLMNLNYHDRDPAAVAAEHLEWGERQAPAATRNAVRKRRADDGVLRIGYVSPDLRAHSVAFFIEPLLARHDRQAFEIYCYSDVLRPDPVTRRLQSLATCWRDVRSLSDAGLAEQIAADGIDILVDLAGHTAFNRMGVFAGRAAPVQVSYLGYPNTTGLRTMDYRLTDRWADPAGEADDLHSETLVRLPHGFLCYDAHDDSIDTDRPPRDDAPITFGSFNNLAKVTPAVIALWSRILQAVPDARLVVKTKPLKDDDVRERVYAQFAAHGITRERVELLGWVPGRAEHLALYQRVDIGLDTFPYNGTTTTCEALWMGVPVVTLAGRVHAARVGVSLLSQAGLEELVAGDGDAYVELATALATQPQRLAALRSGLRERLAASSLCDAPAFTRDVEQAYRQMWARYRAGDAQ